MYRLYPTKRILACAPSDAAADVLALRLVDKLPTNSLFRLNWWQRPMQSVPTALLAVSHQASNGTFDLHPLATMLSFSVVVCTCHTAGALGLLGEDIKFDLVIVDEASQATEGEVSIVLYHHANPA
jgi:helicase MOV-10